jgi:diacylglycerol O-acyltransferase / wax synthase
MTTRPMNPQDAAWYHMDGPANLAQVTGILFTREPLDFERVRATYARRLAGFPRFRQRVVESLFGITTPSWEDVANFEIDLHVHHVALPAPRDRAALTTLISDLASTPLDRDQPLWQVHVVDDVDGGSALIMRFHHCIGDGTAMMALSQRLFDTSPDAPLGDEPPEEPREPQPLVDRLLAPAFDTIEWSTKVLAAAVEATIETVANPQQALDKAKLVLAGAGMLVGELLKTDDPQSPLKGAFGMKKAVAWSEPVPVEDVKFIGKRYGAKVNDVLVAGMAGALRTYLAGRGADVDHSTVRAMVPVDLRPPERALDLGNDFGLVVLDLPVQARGPIERLRATRANMDALKQSPEAVAVKTLFTIFGRSPKALEDLAVDMFGSKASVVMTNVAGPRQPLYLAGTEIDRIVFWVPHPGKQLGMGISILSYNGLATLAVIADAHLVPDPETITAQFSREFARMMTAAKRPRAADGGRPPAKRRRTPKRPPADAAPEAS